MYSWSTDEKKMKHDFPLRYVEWKLIQEINHGSDNHKLDRNLLIKLWPKINQELDIYKKRLLEYLIWGKQYSLPINATFWN
jgi:hypothetical protein